MIFKKRKLKPKYENLARLTAYMLFKLYENIEDFEKFKEHINNNMSFDIINDEFIIVKDSKYNIMYFIKRIGKELHIYKANEYNYYILRDKESRN